jgi:hypothetical protein
LAHLFKDVVVLVILICIGLEFFKLDKLMEDHPQLFMLTILATMLHLTVNLVDKFFEIAAEEEPELEQR